MKAQIRRDGSIRDTANVTIHIGEIKYKITEDIEGGLRINKVDFNDSTIVIKTCNSNEIILK